ncbi:hypothetical protein PGTUg99_008280 [Puccinia graminis f. sp. tritici]|uniref:Uncharacterized protein n=1 Tax=Puccinia graminis f. sp. tritici TaxID=56615 RepID=A0A5B0NTL7_PUCGR|nr:hypothetical protein PGTUg99_008280 [Puccinia graminis f. sp. tritici]
MKFSMGFSFITLLIPQAQCLLSQRSSSPAEELKETERNIGSSSRSINPKPTWEPSRGHTD